MKKSKTITIIGTALVTLGALMIATFITIATYTAITGVI